jgi:hypothetical protein
MFTEALQKFVPGLSWDDVDSLISELVEEEDELPAKGFLVTRPA